MLEIGSGKGDFIIKKALQEPNKHFIALERDVSCAGVLAKKIVSSQITNVNLLAMDFDEAYEWLKEWRFAAIYLNFSDPWPKKRHEKRRLTYAPRFQKIVDLAEDGGLIQIKTDNQSFYAFTQKEAAKLVGLTCLNATEDYHFDAENDAMSEYERRFRELGQPICRLLYQKRGENDVPHFL